jgi:hypothetical protein
MTGRASTPTPALAGPLSTPGPALNSYPAGRPVRVRPGRSPGVQNQPVQPYSARTRTVIRSPSA